MPGLASAPGSLSLMMMEVIYSLSIQKDVLFSWRSKIRSETWLSPANSEKLLAALRCVLPHRYSTDSWMQHCAKNSTNHFLPILHLQLISRPCRSRTTTSLILSFRLFSHRCLRMKAFIYI